MWAHVTALSGSTDVAHGAQLRNGIEVWQVEDRCELCDLGKEVIHIFFCMIM